MDERDMAAARMFPWSQIFTQVAASFDSIVDKPSAEILMLKPSIGSGELLRSQLAFASESADHLLPVMPEPAVIDAAAKNLLLGGYMNLDHPRI